MDTAKTLPCKTVQFWIAAVLLCGSGVTGNASVTQIETYKSSFGSLTNPSYLISHQALLIALLNTSQKHLSFPSLTILLQLETQHHIHRLCSTPLPTRMVAAPQDSAQAQVWAHVPLMKMLWCGICVLVFPMMRAVARLHQEPPRQTRVMSLPKFPGFIEEGTETRTWPACVWHCLYRFEPCENVTF